MAKKLVKKPAKKSYKVGYKKLDPDKRIKKGEVRNPKGINISPEKRALKEFHREAISDAIKVTMTSTPKEIEEIMNHPDTSISYKTILGAMLDACEQRSYSKFYEIAEHVIGKIPTKIDMTSGGKPLGEKLEDREKLRKAMKEVDDAC